MPRWEDDVDESLPKPPARPPEPIQAQPAEKEDVRLADEHPPMPRGDDGKAPATSGGQALGDGPTVSATNIEVPDPLKEVAEGEERYEGTNSIKVGLLGGHQVGKSYLFQAMVYRTVHAGILSHYLRNRKPCIWHSETSTGHRHRIALEDFIAAYLAWRRLPSTKESDQRWYRLRLTFDSGLLGKQSWDMDVDFLDGSGEFLERGIPLPAMRKIWESAFENATIMVFCMPMWVAFPNCDTMTEKDWEWRELRLQGFGKIVATYDEIRNRDLKVRTVLALTMADDPRCALRTLTRRWITPLVHETHSKKYFPKLRRRSGITRYLANAREVSDYLYREFAAITYDGLVAEIPAGLNFGCGLPWLVPVSAIDGQKLYRVNAAWNRGERPREAPPIPAHVELPLLAAMCECHNALM